MTLVSSVLLSAAASALAAPTYRVTDLHTDAAHWLTADGTVITITDHPDGTQTYSNIRNGHWS